MNPFGIFAISVLLTMFVFAGIRGVLKRRRARLKREAEAKKRFDEIFQNWCDEHESELEAAYRAMRYSRFTMKDCLRAFEAADEKSKPEPPPPPSPLRRWDG